MANAHVNTCRLNPTLIVIVRAECVPELLSAHVNRKGCRCASEYDLPV